MKIRVFFTIFSDGKKTIFTYDVNENLSVEKDSSKENSYVVFFTATDSDAKGMPIRRRVILHVIVVKEGESYKIDSVK